MKTLRTIFREMPKVGFLLVIGAMVLFPMYMMFVISVMTPAQLERFPWFPVKMDFPHEVAATTGGKLIVEPAALEITPEGEPTRTIPIPGDRRFYVQLPDVGVGQDQWTVRPGPAEPALIAEYRAADVWTVRGAEESFYEITGDGEPGFATAGNRRFDMPEGFTPLLEGLRIKEQARAELQIVAEARRRAEQALAAWHRLEKIEPDEPRNAVELDVAVRRIEAEKLGKQARDAIARAEAFHAAARQQHVSLEEDLGAARDQLRQAAIKLGLVAKRTESLLRRRQTEAHALAEVVQTTPAPRPEVYKVVRGEPVALLLADKPTQVRRVPGKLSVATEWRIDLEPERTFVVESHVEPTPAAGRTPEPGEPLADLRAGRRVTLTWTAGRWTLDGRPLTDIVPCGFRLVIEPGAEAGERRTLEPGTLVGRAVAPKVLVRQSSDVLIVGLAVPDTDGRWRVPPGNGRWVYGTRAERDVPFAVRLVGEAATATDAPATEPELQGSANNVAVNVPAGTPLAELYLNRQRTLLGTPVLGWMAADEEVFLAIPSGFHREFPEPSADRQTRLLRHGTVLARLVMPEARLRVAEGHILVDMVCRYEGGETVEATWGDGRWALPLGREATLRPVKADTEAMAGPGPWAVTERSAEQQAELERRLDEATDRVEKAASRADSVAGDDTLTRLEAVEQLHRAEEALGRRVQEVVPPDTIAEFRATRHAVLEFLHQQWHLDGRPIDWPPGFRPLDGVGEILSSRRDRVVVAPGNVLARLYAEPSHPWTRRQQPGAVMKTRVAPSDDGRALAVNFTHELPLPVRANVAVSGKDRVDAGQMLFVHRDPQRFDWANYREAFGYVMPFILNTVVVAVTTMIATLFFASMAAFVFSRFEFPGKSLFYAMVIVLLMIPGVLNLVPMFVVVRNMHLLNSLWALILPAIAGGQVMSVYIMRNNLETLAKDLFDAAKIDGASNFQSYLHIALPLSRPIMGTLAIFTLLSQWNNFIWPWIVLKDQDKMTVTAGLALLEGQHLSDYGLQMAGAVLASLPLIVLFFLMMNLFIRGMQSGAIKA